MCVVFWSALMHRVLTSAYSTYKVPTRDEPSNLCWLAVSTKRRLLQPRVRGSSRPFQGSKYPEPRFNRVVGGRSWRLGKGYYTKFRVLDHEQWQGQGRRDPWP